ncbi:MAG: AAA-like domain-containing protein [Blastocatellia bacterium]|nr:AAA-like domain-containing protein [Blastocatellia bacterium]
MGTFDKHNEKTETFPTVPETQKPPITVAEASVSTPEPVLDTLPVVTEAAPPSHPNDPLIGQSVKGRYLIEQELGRGGFGITYLARDSFGGLQSQVFKPVVVKVLLGNIAEDEYLQRKFHQEYEALSLINHPYVVSVLDTGILPGGKPFFVMEYVAGKSLRSIINKGGIDLVQAASLVRQLGQALTAAHQKGIIHRDLKPENILLQSVSESDYQVKIIDFGIAHVGTSQLGKTTKPMTIGTIGYMSPEQLEGTSTFQTDIYALGIIAYELVTGRRPFNPTGENPPVLMYRLSQLQRAGVSVTAKTLRPDVPDEVDAAINRALEFRPEDRFLAARDLGDAFAKALFLKSDSAIPVLEVAHAVDTTAETRVETESGFQTPASAAIPDLLEPVGGAMGLASRFYVVRPTDHEFHAAIHRKDSIVLIKGARQMGKTSLLARGLQQARQAGVRVVFTDLQTLAPRQLESPDTLLLTFGHMLEEQLDLDQSPESVWRPERGPAMNFNRYLKNVVLKPELPPLVWGLDEVDRLFGYAYSSEVFGLFRSWHNARAADPGGPWQRLTQVIAYALEAHLFITDLNQSPFNVGTRLVLSDFTLEQVMELNRRYGEPLTSPQAINHFFHQVGGHPYLVRLGLHEMVAHHLHPEEFYAQAEANDGPLGDHLQRMLLALNQDPGLLELVRSLVQGQVATDTKGFYRLRSAGLVKGDAAEQMSLRCQLYVNYFKQHL